jgi:hypothetical protein
MWYPVEYPRGDGGTLQDARYWLAQNIEGDGARCPCCGQLARLYRRRLNAGISAALCLIYRESIHTGGSWVHVPTLFDRVGASKIRRAGGEYSKGAWWGLLEERTEGAGTLGWYRPTENGVLYVLENLRIPEYAVVYAGEVRLLEGNPVSVRESLASEYNYEELMAW